MTIANERATIESAIRKALPTWDLPKRLRLLGGSVKTELGEDVGVLTAVCYMLPGKLSGVDLCPDSTKACRAACLGTTSGRMVMSSVRKAQAWKSVLWNQVPGLFLQLAELEIQAHANKAHRIGFVPAIRWNGSSDTSVNLELHESMREAGVESYEYTKSGKRAIEYAGDDTRSIALSYTGTPGNIAECEEVLSLGGRVAVIFSGRVEYGGTFLGAPVVNGDEHDAIFLQPRGSVLALKMKGKTITRLKGKTSWIVPSWRVAVDHAAKLQEVN